MLGNPRLELILLLSNLWLKLNLALSSEKKEENMRRF